MRLWDCCEARIHPEIKLLLLSTDRAIPRTLYINKRLTHFCIVELRIFQLKGIFALDSLMMMMMMIGGMKIKINQYLFFGFCTHCLQKNHLNTIINGADLNLFKVGVDFLQCSWCTVRRELL